MTAGVLTGTGARTGDRYGAKDRRADRTVPPWARWRTRSRAARAIRWIERFCRVPYGPREGEAMRLEPFQRETIEALLADGVRTGGLQIPRGNAKSTLAAAIGLWATCDPPDAPQVPVIAFNSKQAERTLLAPARRMVAAHDELSARCVVYTANTDRRIWSAWNDGNYLPLPANVERLQGLNPTVALVDEAQNVPPEVWTAVLQGAGKRSESLTLAIGTPAPNARDSALWDVRTRAADGARIAWVEFAATAGCNVDDRDEWRRANPGLDAGFLFVDALEIELGTVSEGEFRMYRLGQWIDATVAGWLPFGAWDDLPHSDPPPDDTEIVLALAGTWRTSVALVGATLDGALFLAYAADTATDPELDDVLSEAWDRWRVLELVVAPRTRPSIVRRLGDGGLPVSVWPNRVDVEVESSTEFRRAILERRVAHDHSPLVAEHIAATVARSTPDGLLRLAAPDDDDSSVAAARAARMAWARANEVADVPEPAIY